MPQATVLEQQLKLLDLMDRIFMQGVAIIDEPSPSPHSHTDWIYIGVQTLLDFVTTAEQLGKEMQCTHKLSQMQGDPLISKMCYIDLL